MRWTRTTVVTAASLLAAVSLAGAGVAIAAGGDERGGDLAGLAERLKAKDAFAEAVAKELGTTAAKVDAAIAAAAEARISAAVADGSLSKADADLIRAELAEHEGMARRLATPAGIAKELGVSEEKLESAFTKVRKAHALARIDQAVKDGWITEKAAAEMRARVESGEGPEFGGGPGDGRGGHGFGGHGHGGPGPMGFGGNGGPMAFEAPSSSSATAPVGVV